MTDREKYKSAVDAVASSQMRKLEASDIMAHNHQKNFRFKGLVIAAAAVLLLVGVCGGAYAADVGGIQSKVQVWFRGELTDVTLDISNNGSSSEYTASTRRSLPTRKATRGRSWAAASPSGFSAKSDP